MIEARNLTKQFDAFMAVRDLSLTVRKGELLALLGPNGAGKTTTVRMLSAILKPTSGHVRINGFDVVTQADQVRRSIGMLTEQPGLYSRMSGLEYLIFYGRLYGMTDADIKARGLSLFDRFAMPNTAHRRLGEYSKGMRQKVGIIRAMLHDPAVLLLDEPTSAMDPHSARLVRDAINELRQDKRAIILCTHNLAEAETLADRMAIIRQGEIVAYGAIPQLKQQLLGQPLLELRLDRSPNGQIPALSDLITIEAVSDRGLRFRTDDPERTNPRVVRRLMELGLGVVSLREVSQSLEEVYLRVIQQVDGRQTTGNGQQGTGNENDDA
ncbi:MAG: ABC transporter ATP-binding protein [Anaerolineales bacterium]|nr:ABC transporter ATP-binding protein [Anaerolineales bacterium]MCB8951452.1 ABC transporter ATP-binding protein [Ardenticatenales bacterium]